MGRPKIIRDEDLLAVARGLFVEKGIGASTREIAKRAGISEAAIYRRFPTKADLFFAAMAPPTLHIDRLLDGRTGDSRDTCDRLEEIMLGMTDYFRELVPILVPLISHPSFDFEQFARRHSESPIVRLRGGLVGYLEEQEKLGNVASGDVDPAVLTLVAAANSIALFEKLGVHGGEFEEEIIRAMVRSLWRGLAPRRKE